jgi:hypothetical protein
MKAAFFTVFAIGSFIASSIANPIAIANGVEKRQDDDYAALDASLTTLLANIQKQTGAISKYLHPCSFYVSSLCTGSEA